MIHCGQNIWISTQVYNNAKTASSSDSMFVKNIAVNIFTRDVLKSSSVTGSISNRTKGPAKPKLDPVKMLAVRDIYRYYLEEHKKLPEKVVKMKVEDYAEYIRPKIVDLTRPSKKTPPKGAGAKETLKKKKKMLLKLKKRKLEAINSSESSSSSGDSEASESEESSN